MLRAGLSCTSIVALDVTNKNGIGMVPGLCWLVGGWSLPTACWLVELIQVSGCDLQLMVVWVAERALLKSG